MTMPPQENVFVAALAPVTEKNRIHIFV